ncbi:MAG TPA: hypothetical protein VJ898_05820 [Natrialbaceae archaeon]|nr:hypothetical protein [Natrialbaceae archaeon]
MSDEADATVLIVEDEDRLADLSDRIADLGPDEIQSVLRSVDLSMGDLE